MVSSAAALLRLDQLKLRDLLLDHAPDSLDGLDLRGVRCRAGGRQGARDGEFLLLKDEGLLVDFDDLLELRAGGCRAVNQRLAGAADGVLGSLDHAFRLQNALVS